jgi:cyclophilin family peptidyl-prolyl cis-trans isomerase
MRRAIRALGRLERPALSGKLIPLLAHSRPAVRLVAAQAVAQAAQGFRGDSSLEKRGAAWPAITAALGDRAAEESEPFVLGMVALSLGRLPYLSPEEILAAREHLVALSLRVKENPEVLLDVSRGMEMLTRATGGRVPLEAAFVGRLRELARASALDTRVRRHALGALVAARVADDSSLAQALASADPELRRLGLSGLDIASARAIWVSPLLTALGDSVPQVRLEALGAWARVVRESGCSRMRLAAWDAAPSVALLALDLLGSCAVDSLAIPALLQASRPVPGVTWHRAAHALVSLARLAPALARPLLSRAMAHPVWQMRAYAARAAAVLKDTTALELLAADSSDNVREAAVTGLHGIAGHREDSLYRAQLARRDYQLVLTAAGALAGSPEREPAAGAVLSALDRISAERKETSRDPRVALLVRLRELGAAALAPRLVPYLGDFDAVVADSVAAILTGWTGRAVPASARPLEAVRVTPAEVEALRGKRLRFTMASGSAFEVELLVDQAPVTVVRVAVLAGRGYYDGLSFHRVVANFVIQGGSPGANEFAGDSLFLRDELGPVSHERGTLGISTRGRDTGDGQLFINLVDNPRLDYEYTAWARVVEGMAAVQAILEGDVIRRVEIR